MSNEKGKRQSRRVIGVDVARGVASLIMIQGHAYDGWVDAEGKAGAAYAFTRLLGTLPLPAFLVLAGAAVMLRVQTAELRGELASQVRRQLMRRGLEVMLWGYGTNIVYALMDGWQSPWTFLRGDVLHVIGLGILLVSWVGVRPVDSGPQVSARRVLHAALCLGLVLTLVSPWLNGLVLETPNPTGLGLALWPLAALVVDVPGVAVMPLVPLGSWLCVGVVIASAMARDRRLSGKGAVAGARGGFLLWLGFASVLVAWTAWKLTSEFSPDQLTRADFGIYLNVVDLAARGVFVLALCAGLSPYLPERLRSVLVIIGQGSLYAYVFHIPFCYGALGRGWIGQLSMPEASVGVVLLSLASVAAVYLRRGVKRRSG